MKDVNGILTNYVATLTDISRQGRRRENRAIGVLRSPYALPNRRLLFDRLKQALGTCVRNGRKSAVLFLDLDHFKTLNDSLGHDIGDVLLQQVAERLTACVRVNDTVARMGGDEFVVVLEELSEQELKAAEQAETIANKILHELNQPFNLNNHIHHNTPSIGLPCSATMSRG